MAGFVVVPALLSTFSLTALLLIAPWLLSLGFGLWTLVTLWLAVATKELLIGRYRPLRTPAWSAFHLRHWIVVRMVRLVPWTLLEGTEAKNVALRALGARIGKRVHIHRGVDVLNGGWDLLELGDDVSVLREVHLGLAELDAGELVIGPVAHRRRRDAGDARQHRSRHHDRCGRDRARAVVCAGRRRGAGRRGLGRRAGRDDRPHACAGGDRRRRRRHVAVVVHRVDAVGAGCCTRRCWRCR